MFKNKKFRARSRRRNLTREIESIRVQTTHAERKPRKKQHEPEDYTFSQNQYEDYLTLNGIVNRTGIAKGDSYTFILKELLDNAVADVEKSNNPLVQGEIK